MKLPRTIFFVMLLSVATVPALQDPVQELEEDDQKIVTTWKRDGKVNLIVTSYKSEDSRMIVQHIMFNGEKVMRLVEFKGKRSSVVEPESPVRVGVEYDEKGDMISVSLSQKGILPVEVYEATD
ncbi:MAG: hypothetical protein AAF357_19230, partial [Verrucomicrobiota bacterium]